MRVGLGFPVNKEHFLFVVRTEPLLSNPSTPWSLLCFRLPLRLLISKSGRSHRQAGTATSPTALSGVSSVGHRAGRRYLLSATCLSPSVPAPSISLRTYVIPRWRYTFRREIGNLHRLLNSSCDPTLFWYANLTENLNFLPTLRKLFCPWTRSV